MIDTLDYEIVTSSNGASCEKADDAFLSITGDLGASVRWAECQIMFTCCFYWHGLGQVRLSRLRHQRIECQSVLTRRRIGAATN